MFRFDTPGARLRANAFLEGLSYVLLLFVAMPLKYLADQPLPVRLMGSIHGALFVWLGWQVFWSMRQRGRGFVWGARIAIASLLPFGTFFLDRGLHAEEQADRQAQ